MTIHSVRDLLVLSLPCLATALPSQSASSSSKDKLYRREVDGIHYNVFEHRATQAQLSYVSNSGICETTPGVEQHSGYLTVGTNMSMWFWFFAARNNPSTAPLALWLNGGPGCSSMIGLFQENGPCHFVNNETEPSLNPYSWNTHANMLYVDQPIGTGFSYGTDNATSTVTAAPFVWKLLQAFFANFPEYEARHFGLFTESYGGHYGPEFADYFETQNAAVEAGTVEGDRINLVALGINNGWIDANISYWAYPEYAYKNTYKQLVNESTYESLVAAYWDQCEPAEATCPGETGDDSACLNADNICYDTIEGPVENGPVDFDAYDVREPSNDPYPPETYVSYLQRPDIAKAIGARVKYDECPDDPYYKIANTGDDARSFLPSLSRVVQSGVRVLLWAGDADWICNWIGVLATANVVDYNGRTEFAAAKTRPYKVNGTKLGEYKTVQNLGWLQVYDAGHEVPYYQPELALQAFWQTLQDQPLHSTC